MNKKEKTIGIETIIAMFVIAMGDWNGTQWEYFPNLPKCFTENLNIQASCGRNADFLRLTVNDLFGVECWFIDKDEDLFYYSLDDVKKAHPFLFVSIVTHVFDMIENVNDI